MKALVLLNAAAGTLAASTQRDEAQRIRETFRQEGIEAEVRSLPGTELCEAARSARTGDVDLIVAGGGDGTINAIATELVGSDKAFAILPLGTLNHLARELEMPFELESAIRAIARGRAVPFTVGEVSGRTFLSFSAVGVYSHIVKHRDVQRRTLGRQKWPAMLAAAVRVLRRPPLFGVRVRTGTSEVRRLTPLVYISLSPYQLRLLGLEDYSCGPRQALNVYLGRRTTRLGLLWLFVRALLRLVRAPADFEVLCLSDMTLSVRRRHLRVALDGEIVDLPSPLEYRIRPGALRLVMPADPEGPGPDRAALAALG